jgi:hypothetical protein
LLDAGAVNRNFFQHFRCSSVPYTKAGREKINTDSVLFIGEKLVCDGNVIILQYLSVVCN